MTRSRGVVVLVLVVGALLGAAAGAHAASLHARGSVEQAYATGLRPRARATLLRHGKVLRRHRADPQAGVLFSGLRPGRGYRIRSGSRSSGSLTVMSGRDAPPSTKTYRQTISAQPGQGELTAPDAANYQYLTTRDGTKLAIDVHTPGGPGPWPTLVEYSGYGYATPYGAPQSGLGSYVTLLGYAVVDVNMRGTGCSGGAFSYFERLQALDGYDVIETIARQPWVLHHKVGMLGISYGGISQLFVAATDPPALAAIAPLSVIDSTQTTLYPGGILNTGFALTWGQQRVHDALPASPTGGQPWALERIRQGDRTCNANQALHGEATNLIAESRRNAHDVPSVADALDPVTFVDKIRAPSFVVCQFTDEQTGGHCPALAEHMTGARREWFTFTNGAHIDSLDPDTLTRLIDFYDLYVERIAPPVLSPAVRAAIGGVLYQAEMGISGISLPPDPVQGLSNYRAALAKFDAQPEVRVMFDNGAGKGPLDSGRPGDPYPAFQAGFRSFPIPGTRARSWYLGIDGSLTDSRPRRARADRFTWNPRARPATDVRKPSPQESGPGGLWTASPDYRWTYNPAGTAASYLSAPLRSNVVAIGAGAVHVWVSASTPNVDLQATVSEVRPDGTETFVQSGWLRADERRLGSGSTLLEPLPTFAARDVGPLPRGRFASVAIPLYYEGHAYRRGSRIRLTISAPGGDQPIWAFRRTSPRGRARVLIAHSRAMASRLILPVVPGVRVPAGLPPCPGLRGEPCRAYRRYRDTSVRLRG
ncbi:MAG TPA: CocE/NonD family hydrolase [Solirubrobacteraceae bacterium]|nr:CocE/NonD family hydrolase [Solirubrobacteraceae bacterium]